jgi:uncharacterized integral membrane protein
VLRRIVWLLAAFPIAVILIALLIANRHSVQLILDPFRPENPALALTMPLSVCIWLSLLVGVLIGSLATWLRQSRWRRSARLRAQESIRWQSEADRLARERDVMTSASPGRSLAVARN